MNSVYGTSCEVGFPIRKSPGQSLFASSPTLIAGYHVLHRLLPPRHPPYALIRMTSRHHASCAAGRGAGGASRDRTGDLLVANQALSQLSYGPSSMGRNRPRAKSVVLARHAPLRWWVWEELHLRPHPYQGCALTN